MKTLDATQAVADFSRILDAVQSLHESFTIVKQGVPCACLVPAVDSGTTSHQLADDLATADLSAEDRRAFAGDVRRGRKSLKPLRNPWD